MKIRLFGIANDSIVDGPGLRYTIFTQGCYHKCSGCHNPKSHDMNGGYLKDINEIIAEIDENQLIEICKAVKYRGLNIVIYSGFIFEQIIKDSRMKSLLEVCDMLIDGKFEQDKKSLSLLYRGSTNQRLINIQKSLKYEKVIEYETNEYNEIII